MSIFDDIERDAQTGTQTPWKFQTVKTSCGVCHKIGPFKYNNGEETSACVYEDYPWNTHSEPEANARRIARLPDLERIALAANELAEVAYLALSLIDQDNLEAKAGWDALDIAATTALTAFREATQ